MAAVVPFRVDTPPGALADLAERLAATRWPARATRPGWNAGVDQDCLRALIEWWRDGFDWPAHQERVNRHPQFLADVDGAAVHFIHVRGHGPAPFPLLLTHGWPSTCWEFLPLIERLAGRPDDAAFGFDLVIPSLPGFAFSDRVPHAADIPVIWHRLMTDVLGYSRYGAHGGDIGAMVTNRLALEHPDTVAGIHVTMPAEPAEPTTLTPQERTFLSQGQAAQETGGGYAHIQRTRPDTLATALNDSPAGLAAWTVDKWHDWSDHSRPGMTGTIC